MHWCVTLRFILVVGGPLKCIHFPVITTQVSVSVIVVATDHFDHVDLKRRGRHTHTEPGRNHALSALAFITLDMLRQHRCLAIERNAKTQGPSTRNLRSGSWVSASIRASLHSEVGFTIQPKPLVGARFIQQTGARCHEWKRPSAASWGNGRPWYGRPAPPERAAYLLSASSTRAPARAPET